jgi:hypothetical protein
MRLEKQLKACGFRGSVEEFTKVLPNLLEQLFPGCTDEEVLCDPRAKAIPYCDAVRARFDFDFPESLILKTLINTRKAGRRKS